MKHQTKQCGGLIAHFVGDTITCVRVTSDAAINDVSCDKAVCNNFDHTKGVN